ncbi:MAG: hypothetical protein GY950_32180, partial [bacterium]|nr:hypothetical protein [bacterium]
CILFLIILAVWGTCAPVPVLDALEKPEEEEQPLQELFQTETVYPQEKGEIQFSVIADFNKKKNRESLYFPLLIEYGITDNWQVEMELSPYLYKKNLLGKKRYGIDTLEIGTKYSFMNIADTRLHAAVGFELGIPFRRSGEPTGDEEIEYEPFFILAKDFPGLNNAQVFTELRLGIEKDFEEMEFNWNIGFFIPVGRYCFTGELNFTGGENKELYFTPGLVWNLPGTWELGTGVAIGLNDFSDNFRVILILTYEFNVVKTKD